MSISDWTEIAKIAESITVVTILAFVIIAGSRGIWVWGYQYKELKEANVQDSTRLRTECDARIQEYKEDRDEWKQVALSGTLQARETLELIKKRRVS